jgi:membrane-bound lytic murein transglycosylase D
MQLNRHSGHYHISRTAITFAAMRFLAAAWVLCAVASSGQAPQVPHKMHFAGMTLSINAAARHEIQKDVDALTISPRYFNIKVERAKTYFPIIEKIFKEESVPDELKYLVIQESALISDAVSTSNAVGYWQFKAETGRQMGLRINQRVDERMNIVASTKGAARYFKESNHYFNNWLLVVQSYQMGIGGTMRAVGERDLGERHMDVTPETYWYVKKYLAHKVAFEHALGGAHGQVAVTPIIASGVSLDEISRKSGVDVEKLKDYNKWIKEGAVPDDADYSIVIPKGDLTDFNTLWLASNKKSTPLAVAPTTSPSTTVIKETEVNGLRALIAPQRESITTLAKRTDVDLSDFIRWNDATIDWTVNPGEVYYLQRKTTTGRQSSYTSQKGDNLRTVSQANGIRLKTLRRWNPRLPDQLRPGTLIYLSDPPGKSNSSEVQMVELDHSSPFEWGISGKGESDYVIKDSEPAKEPKLRPSRKSELISAPAEKKQALTATEHTVLAGETLYAIAIRYGLKVVDLEQLNHLVKDSPLKPGMVLKLSTDEAARPTHIVKPTDTLYSIARFYGLSVKELMDLNEKKDFDLKPGQTLIVR